jgi:hypothetical protein
MTPSLSYNIELNDGGASICFQSVISGYDVVSAVEQVGSDSGRTRVPGEYYFNIEEGKKTLEFDLDTISHRMP